MYGCMIILNYRIILHTPRADVVALQFGTLCMCMVFKSLNTKVNIHANYLATKIQIIKRK